MRPAFFGLLLAILATPLPALEVTWYGHAAFRFKSNRGTTIFMDPWITNPVNPSGERMLDEIHQADYIFISHGHGDAIGDALKIIRKTRAKVVTTYSLANRLTQSLGFPQERLPPSLQMDVGGELNLAPDLNVWAVQALHSSEIIDPKGTLWNAGPAVGFVLHFQDDQKRIYHTGDTGLYMDMKLVSLFGDIDLMLIPIGGQFTMGPRTAAVAASIVKPQTLIPMRYGTFEALKGTPEEFSRHLKTYGVSSRVKVLDINKYYEF